MMNILVSSAAITAAPSIAVAGPDDDSQLLSLRSQIIEAYEAAMAYDEDITRCHIVWTEEHRRLRLEALAGDSDLSDDEIWQSVKQIPEASEQTRLASLQEPHFARMDKLVRKMWSLPARSAEGRRAKVDVLLKCVAGSGWNDSDDDADYDIEMARSLLIEFVGGEPAEELRQRFIS